MHRYREYIENENHEINNNNDSDNNDYIDAFITILDELLEKKDDEAIKIHINRPREKNFISIHKILENHIIKAIKEFNNNTVIYLLSFINIYNLNELLLTAIK